MGSLFGNLSFEHDGWLTLDAGLRYDRYRLTGKTGFTTWAYPIGVTGVDVPRERTEFAYDVEREEGASRRPSVSASSRGWTGCSFTPAGAAAGARP
jgi:outer membrane receptor protein involved in Fe transport